MQSGFDIKMKPNHYSQHQINKPYQNQTSLPNTSRDPAMDKRTRGLSNKPSRIDPPELLVRTWQWNQWKEKLNDLSTMHELGITIIHDSSQGAFQFRSNSSIKLKSQLTNVNWFWKLIIKKPRPAWALCTCINKVQPIYNSKVLLGTETKAGK